MVLITKENAMRQLEVMGFPRDSIVAGIVLGKTRLSTNDLRLIRGLIDSLGIASTKELLVNSDSFKAVKQRRRKDGKRSSTMGNDIFTFLYDFAPALQRMTSPLLRKKGYRLHLVGRAGEKPFFNALEIVRENTHWDVGRISFDLAYLHGKPGVVIGSFQGRNKKIVEQFKQDMKTPPLLFLFRRFQHAFPRASQRLALNPRHHPYKNLNSVTIASILHSRGEITNKELTGYDLHGNSAVEQKVKAEKARINNAVSGMHNAALQSAGFKRRMNSRYLRTKTFLAQRKRIVDRKKRR